MAAVTPIANPWAGGGSANLVEPSSAKKDLGWLGAEKPPHEYFNWLMNQTDDKINEIISAYLNKTIAQTMTGDLTLSGAKLIGDATAAEPQLLFESYAGVSIATKSRLYYTPGGGFTHSTNAAWNNSTNVWEPDDTTEDAYAKVFLNPATLTMKFKKATVPASWSDGSWDSYQILSDIDITNSDRQTCERFVSGSYCYNTRAFLMITNSDIVTRNIQGEGFCTFGRYLNGAGIGDMTITGIHAASNWTANGGVPPAAGTMQIESGDPIGMVFKTTVSPAVPASTTDWVYYDLVVQK
jgi:hypothetical protein